MARPAQFWDTVLQLLEYSVCTSVVPYSTSLASTLVCPCRLSFLSYTAVAKYAMCELLLMIWLGNVFSAVNLSGCAMYSFFWFSMLVYICLVYSVSFFIVCEILVRIRIRGCVILSNLDLDPDPVIFVRDLQDGNKTLFFTTFFCFLLFKSTFASFLKIKSPKEETEY